MYDKIFEQQPTTMPHHEQQKEKDSRCKHLSSSSSSSDDNNTQPTTKQNPYQRKTQDRKVFNNIDKNRRILRDVRAYIPLSSPLQPTKQQQASFSPSQFSVDF
jgi:hypothetical protein